MKRATQGVTLIALKDDSLVAVQRIAEKDVEEEKAEEQKEAQKVSSETQSEPSENENQAQ